MAAISLTESSNLHIHHRNVSTKMKAIRGRFYDISRAIYKKVGDKFNKIIELASIKDNHLEKTRMTISAKNMQPIVMEAIGEVQKSHADQAKEMALAAKVAKDNFIHTHQLTFDADEFDEEVVTSHPTIFAKTLFSNLSASAHINLTKLFAEKVIPLPEMMKNICCFDYALLAIGDFETANITYTQNELPNILLERGYKIVDEPQPGDLVLFSDSGIPTHLGVVRKKGLIESKWGNGHPHAYLHTLENAPEGYGTEIVYYRPPLKISQASA